MTLMNAVFVRLIDRYLIWNDPLSSPRPAMEI